MLSLKKTSPCLRNHLRRIIFFSSTSSDYLQTTTIPTYHFQKSLLRLPIPKLQETLDRYKASVEPIVSPSEFKQTCDIIESFGKNEGPALHAALLTRDKAAPETSYINQWWYDMYVTSRDPIMINVNPQIRLRDDPDVLKMTQLQRATSLIVSSVRFFITLRDGHLQPDVYHTKPSWSKTPAFEHGCRLLPEAVAFYGAAACGAYPLDMSQYKHLFHSSRIPCRGKDRLVLYPEAKHIVVQVGASFYSVPVLTETGSAVAASVIYRQLASILTAHKDTTASVEPLGLGLLTTLPRDAWADARDTLKNHAPENATSLQTIDSALFAVSLEHTSPSSTVELSRCFLHGSGNNRWFDKSFQLIVAANAKASVNFEHSWGDGVAVLRYLNETHMDSVATGGVSVSESAAQKGMPCPPLPFRIDPVTAETLTVASQSFREWTSRLYVESAELDIAKASLKKYKVSLDGVMQMAIQLAHFRLHGHFVATYESASTSAFKHGRTEVVRSCTTESSDFCQLMTTEGASVRDKDTALRRAIDKHSTLAKQGVMGQGFDRHLFALQKMAALDASSSSGAGPSLFTDSSYTTMNRIILSTSTLSSPHLEGGSFGPVNEDCYAVGYGMEEFSLFTLASYRKDLPQLSDALTQSLQEIVTVLEATHPRET